MAKPVVLRPGASSSRRPPANSAIQDMAFELRPLPLALVRPSADNERTRYLNIGLPTRNPFAPDHPLHGETQQVIASILDLADNLKHHPLQEPPSVFPIGSHYEIISGHRRLFALHLLYGHQLETTHVEFRVYGRRPADVATRRVIENEQKKGLTLRQKFFQFLTALREIAPDVTDYRQLPLSQEEIAPRVGISQTQVSFYLSYTQWPLLCDAIAEGVVTKADDATQLVGLARRSEVEFKRKLAERYLALNQPLPEALVGLPPRRLPQAVKIPTPGITNLTFLQEMLQAFAPRYQLPLERVNWNSAESIKQAWRTLIAAANKDGSKGV